MVWTLRSTTIEQNPERRQFLRVTFTFEDGAGEQATYTEQHVPDQAIIPKLAADWLRQYNQIDAQLKAPLTDAEIAAAVDALLTPPTPPAPTEAQLRDAAYSQKKQALLRLEDLVAAGALPTDDPAVLAAKAGVLKAGQDVLPDVLAVAVDLVRP